MRTTSVGKRREQATDSVREQIADAYKRMSSFYRPAAPSDDLGNITVPEEELNLEAEVRDYAKQWWAEEDEQTFRTGRCDYPTREATIYTIEAARALNEARPKRAASLLKLALAEIQDAEGVVRSSSTERVIGKIAAEPPQVPQR